MLEKIILNRVHKFLEGSSSEEQAGCRSGRGCVDHIHSLRCIIDKYYQYNKPLVVTFLDFKGAFDSVHRRAMPVLLRSRGIPSKIVSLIGMLYSDAKSAVRIGNSHSDPFSVSSGVRQGSILSPVLFNCYIEHIMSHVRPKCLHDFEYVDDITLLNSSPRAAQSAIDVMIKVAGSVGLTLNPSKCKTMYINCPEPYEPIFIGADSIDIVDKFVYLGSVISANSSITADVDRRLECAFKAYNHLRPAVFDNKQVSKETKMLVYQSSVRSVLTYGAVTWPHIRTEIAKLDIFDRARIRWIQGVGLADPLTNSDLYRNANVPSLDSVIRRMRLTWFGHICRMHPTRLPRLFTFLEVDKSWCRSQGRCRKNFTDSIKEDAEQITGGAAVYGLRLWKTQWLHIISQLTDNRAQWRAAVRDATVATYAHRPP